jgi:hypothetical protein
VIVSDSPEATESSEEIEKVSEEKVVIDDKRSTEDVDDKA